MNELTHLDLFSGIGGFALAARACGLRTVTFCECEPRCRAFLAKAWPGVPCWPNVKTFHWGVADSDEIRRDIRAEQERQTESGWFAADLGAALHRGPVFLLTAGVPCQPASRAGKQRGEKDDRWLWPQAIRVLSEVRPAWAIFENPPGIGDVGLARILSEVEAKGYETRVFSIPACAVGSPHRRERYWIVAHTKDSGCGGNVRRSETPEGFESRRIKLADSTEPGREGADSESGPDGCGPEHRQEHMVNAGSGECCDGSQQYSQSKDYTANGDSRREYIGGQFNNGNVADSAQRGQREHGSAPRCERHADQCGEGGLGHAEGYDGWWEQMQGGGSQGRNAIAGSGFWSRFIWLPCADGKLRRAPDDSFGLVDGLHRSVLAALGNSIVPQVAEIIIRCAVQSDLAEREQ